MNIQKDESDATYQIKSYEPGKIVINAETYTQSVIIRPHTLLAPWRPQSLADIRAEDFETLNLDKPTILLLGTGAKLQIPAQGLLRPLFEMGIGVEFMDSKAACYTYTILSSEGRNVAACILII